MIVITTSGSRLLDGREDWRLLDALTLGIALGQGYAGSEPAAAASYLRALDPPLHEGDAVVWAWTDQPVTRRHVTLPGFELVPPKRAPRKPATARRAKGTNRRRAA